VCSIADAVYDVIGYVHPFMTAPHNGMKFSTPDEQYDLLAVVNCASQLGGSWWYTECSLWCPTSTAPMWFSRGDAGWYAMERVRMMIKLQ